MSLFCGFLYDKETGNVRRKYARRDGHIGQGDLPDGTIGVIEDFVIDGNARDFQLDLVALAAGTITLNPRTDNIPSVDYKRTRARARIDRLIEKRRAMFVTRGFGQALDYQEKLREAQAYLRDDNPDAADYPMLAAEVGFHGTTSINEMAQLVVRKSKSLRRALAALNTRKFALIRAIDAAATNEELESVFENLSWPEASMGA